MTNVQALGTSGSLATGTSGVTAPGAALSKNDFLKLLITQLRYQDPLNPLDQNQFLSQTAQFTSLENLQNISKELEDLKQISTGSGLTQAAGLLGRTVSVSGRDVSFDGATPVELPFTLSAPASGVAVDILDPQGTRLRRLTAGSAAAGPSAITWDGKDDMGRPLTAGSYFYRVSASGGTAGSAPLAVARQGVVTGLQADGTRLLYRMGDALVRQEDVVAVQ